MQGVGTFVAEPKSQSALFEVHNIADEIASRGHRHTCQVITLEEEAAGSERALALDMREGQKVFHSLIVHYENDIPVQIEDRFRLSAGARRHHPQPIAMNPSRR
jgi:GntR family histidine utilization transcriptional repressor